MNLKNEKLNLNKIKNDINITTNKINELNVKEENEIRENIIISKLKLRKKG